MIPLICCTRTNKPNYDIWRPMMFDHYHASRLWSNPLSYGPAPERPHPPGYFVYLDNLSRDLDHLVILRQVTPVALSLPRDISVVQNKEHEDRNAAFILYTNMRPILRLIQSPFEIDGVSITVKFSARSVHPNPQPVFLLDQ